MAIQRSSASSLYRIQESFIELGIPMKLVKHINMCLTEMYSRFWVGKNLPDMLRMRNGLKKRDGVSPLLFNFTLDYTVSRFQVNQHGLKLNQLLIYAADVNILGGSVHTNRPMQKFWQWLVRRLD